MAILRYILPTALALLLAGCYEDFVPKIDTEPVLCINSLITAGEPMEVNVTHTWVFNDAAAEKNHGVDDAVVSIYANGELRDDDYLPAEGDNIRIVAESRKYGRAEASVTVPTAVPIAAVDFKPEVLSVWNDPEQAMTEYISFDIRISMRIDDIDATEDYFKLDYNWESPATEDYVSFNPGTFDYDAESVFKEHIGVFESVIGADDDVYLIFSDRQFAGKSYTLNLHFNNASYGVTAQQYDPELYDCKITFYLATVSRSYYDRAIYVWQRDSGVIGDLGDLGFAEPIRGYSNVSSGAGVVAARSFASCTIDLKDFIESTLKQPLNNN